jgi:hypothetical protein
MIYDGSTSLSKAIADDLKLCSIANTNKISKLTRQAVDALGLNVPVGQVRKTVDENRAIYQWLKDNVLPVTQSNLEPPATNQLPIAPTDLLENKTIDDNVLPVTQPITKQRNKTKRDKRFSGFTRISFNVTGNTQRQHISLEPEFIKALELIAPANRNQWLSDTVSSWIAANGVESSTRIVKLSIVNALIERAKT